MEDSDQMDFSFILPPSAPASTEPAYCFHLTALILHLTATNAHSGNHCVLMLSSNAAYTRCFEPLQEHPALVLPFCQPNSSSQENPENSQDCTTHSTCLLPRRLQAEEVGGEKQRSGVAVSNLWKNRFHLLIFPWPVRLVPPPGCS